MAVPDIFDRPALALRRARAQGAPADFLLRHVAKEASERLAAVLRPLERAVEIGSLSDAMGDALRDGGRSVVRLGPLAGHADVVGREDALPFATGSFDLAVSALSLQFVDDLPGTLVQVRRILRPDGLFLAAFLGGSTLTELRQAFTAAEIEIEGGASPRVSPSIDVRDAGALLQRAGFALPVTDSDTLTVRYRDTFSLMADLRAMGATNVLAERRRVPTRRSTLLRMAEIYASRFSDPDGKSGLHSRSSGCPAGHRTRASKSPSGPAPPRSRLADALGVREMKPSAGER